jgi:hypothetical protein
MGSSTPQEGGTTNEEYYGQPQQMFKKDFQLTAQNIFFFFLQETCLPAKAGAVRRFIKK